MGSTRRYVSRPPFWTDPSLLYAWAVFVVLIACYAGLRYSTQDFASFHASAVALLQHESPYRLGPTMRPTLSAPLWIVLTSPLAWWSPPTAYLLWTALGAGGFVASLWLAMTRASVSAAWFTAWALTSVGGGVAILEGQVVFVLLPVTTVAWLADREDRQILAGTMMGALCYFKPFFGLFMIYWLVRRAWRAVYSTGLTGAGLLAASAFVPNVSFTDWGRQLLVTRGDAIFTNGSALALMTRAFSPASREYYPPLVGSVGLQWGMSLVIVVAVLIWIWKRGATRDSQWALVGIAAVILSPLGWMYYLTLFAGPLARTFRGRRAAIALVGCNLPLGLFQFANATTLVGLTIGSLPCWAYLWILSSIPHDELPHAHMPRTIRP